MSEENNAKINQQKEELNKTLLTMFDYLDLKGDLRIEEKNGKLQVKITSDDAGRIIGRKGQISRNQGNTVRIGKRQPVIHIVQIVTLIAANRIHGKLHVKAIGNRFITDIYSPFNGRTALPDTLKILRCRSAGHNFKFSALKIVIAQRVQKRIVGIGRRTAR